VQRRTVVDGTTASVDTRRMIDMETGSNFSDDEGQNLHWMEDFNDLTVDDLRELPHQVQLGLDLSVFD